MNKFEKALDILNSQEKKKSLQVFLLILVGMLLEMLGIGLIVPLINIVNNIEAIKEIPGGGIIYSYIKELNKIQLIVYAFSIFLVISLIKMLILMVIVREQTKFTYGLLTTISSRLFLNYMRKDYRFHLKHNSSYLVKNTITEAQIFITHIVSPFFTILTELTVLLGLLLVLLFIDFKGTVTISVLMGGFGILFYTFMRLKLKKSGLERIYHEGERLKYLTEGYNSVKEIKINGKENFYYNRYLFSISKSVAATSQQVFINQLPRLILEFFGVLVICIYIFIQLHRGVDFDNLISVLIVYAVAAFRIMPSVNRIIGSISAILFSKSVIDHIHVKDSMNEDNKSSSFLNDFTKLEINSLSYKHDDGSLALDKISFSIKKGDFVGLVGVSGSGKTTLINVIMGLLPCSNDVVFINGFDINQCKKEWQNKIGYVGQNINLIDNTIVNNIAFGVEESNIDYNRINKIIIDLKINSFIDELENGIDTIVGENGGLLSGGQKQRICIARALYKNPEMLILDEATSALDESTESNIMDVLSSNFKDITILFITHRTSTLKYCNRIVNLEKGRVKSEINNVENRK
ncbi:ABC transporter ATP-binding protein/permease [Acinetobacter lwoffii]|uniref:ATP-binding cassette domain-containing protein n=1 Tax=Acinetobacter lwoffii TaxID=28090 RepID=UPI00209B57B0|nr:ABC transporter ATP-binding protein [Acinetobacter lwoffii]MCO8097223.1 ABC transporter ATP-binding protein/permease [Acinetobacter lwoffii]